MARHFRGVCLYYRSQELGGLVWGTNPPSLLRDKRFIMRSLLIVGLLGLGWGFLQDLVSSSSTCLSVALFSPV